MCHEHDATFHPLPLTYAASQPVSEVEIRPYGNLEHSWKEKKRDQL